MANRGREYAENLVGALDRSAYNQQRDVAQNTYNTNWQNVQNQYKNLQDKLKLQQQRANTDFAEGLVNVAENSLNRERQGSSNLANRGLASSGLTNMLEQSDIMQKGEDIGKLLKNAGDISLQTANNLSEGTSKFASEGSGLLKKLGDTLGDIGDAETALQNRYNNTLAGIAGAMDEREANNELQAMQRAASRGSGGSSKKEKEIDKELNEFYTRSAIAETLMNPELNDQQKSNYLGIMFGLGNSGDIVRTYNKNVNATKTREDEIAGLKKSIENESNIGKAYKKDAQRLIDSLNDEYSIKSWEGVNNAQSKAFDTMRRYVNGDKNISKDDFANAYGTFYGDMNANKQKQNIANAIDSILYPKLAGNEEKLRQLENSPITYDDLAKLIYGIR